MLRKETFSFTTEENRQKWIEKCKNWIQSPTEECYDTYILDRDEVGKEFDRWLRWALLHKSIYGKECHIPIETSSEIMEYGQGRPADLIALYGTDEDGEVPISKSTLEDDARFGQGCPVSQSVVEELNARQIANKKHEINQQLKLWEYRCAHNGSSPEPTPEQLKNKIRNELANKSEIFFFETKKDRKAWIKRCKANHNKLPPEIEEDQNIIPGGFVDRQYNRWINWARQYQATYGKERKIPIEKISEVKPEFFHSVRTNPVNFKPVTPESSQTPESPISEEGRRILLRYHPTVFGNKSDMKELIKEHNDYKTAHNGRSPTPGSEQ